jgi:hypothetical protein
MADIFLSYASEDVDRAKSLVQVLEGHGWSVWWDREVSVGDSFRQTIAEELATAGCIIVLWSRESVNSDWVTSEAEEGKNRNALAPVLIDDVTIPMGFRSIQTARLYDWKGDLQHQGLKNLLNAVAKITRQSRRPVEIKRRGAGWLRSDSGEIRTKPAILIGALVILAIAVAGVYYSTKNRRPTEDGNKTPPANNRQENKSANSLNGSTNPPVTVTPPPPEPAEAGKPSELSARVAQVEVDPAPTAEGAQVFVRLSVRNTGRPSIAENFRLNIQSNKVNFKGAPADMAQDYTFIPAGKASKIVISREESLAHKTENPIETGGQKNGWMRFVVPEVKPDDLTQPGVTYTISLADVWGKPLSANYVLP